MPSPETKLNADVDRPQVVGMVRTGVGDGFGDGLGSEEEEPEHQHAQATSDPPQMNQGSVRQGA